MRYKGFANATIDFDVNWKIVAFHLNRLLGTRHQELGRSWVGRCESLNDANKHRICRRRTLVRVPFFERSSEKALLR
jgi:hypothetical protein